MTINVRRVTVDDAEAWKALYSGYRTFYRLPEDAAVVAQTWEWIVNGEHGLVGLIATDDDVPVGLANTRWFARPSSAALGLYLDDLFTLPDVRSRGVGRALLTSVAQVAGEGGANVVRWITAADNVTARRLYDDVARETPWVTYDMSPSV
ncbi:GNAT family N-acetyltransferase [Paeniglutamicibacter sp. MACA_103]|uniref:GNAT family N-acetyltransferase n=1 Tax=Paeniglutamicibacter sp. MACA_103 TaxID=3377337 RepID=UPI003895ED67